MIDKGNDLLFFYNNENINKLTLYVIQALLCLIYSNIGVNCPSCSEYIHIEVFVPLI